MHAHNGGRHAQPRGPRHAKPKEHSPNRRRNTIGTIFLAMLLTLVFGAPTATADHAEATWSGNGDSRVVNETTVHLEGGTNLGTSVETAALGVTVDQGDEISFQYELFGEATCAAGAPRVFVVVDGAPASANNSWDANQPAGTECGTGQTVTFAVDRSGGITAAGIVYDNVPAGENQVVDSIRVSNLTIDDKLIHFMNPEPEPTVVTPLVNFTHPDCDEPGLVDHVEVEGVKYHGTADGQELSHGDKAFVKATAEEGYVLDPETKSFFKFLAVRNPCDGTDGTDGTDGKDGEVVTVTDDDDEDDTVTVTKLPTRINTGR